VSADTVSASTVRTSTSTSLLDGLHDPGDQAAWRQFVDRYRPLIISYACRSFQLTVEDAEDAAQVALADFAQAYQKGQYDRDKGRLRKWLFGIATRRIHNLMRRNQRNREVQVAGSTGDTGLLPGIPDEDQLAQLWEAEWQHAVVRQCLEEIRFQFDARTVRAFELYVWREQAAAQVARQLDMSENAVYLARHRVLKRLREILPRMEEIW
jgi:RNA polymerase sigma factor (sigma-70 family)